MNVSDVFYIYSGSKLDFGKQQVDENGINFVSRNSNNNGVVGKVALEEGMKVYKKGDITVPLGGSYLLSCFVQEEDFVTAQNVAVLRAKNENMCDIEKWFYCYALRENRFKFVAFGREVNKYLQDIELPNSIPHWVYSCNMDTVYTANTSQKSLLDVEHWEWFYIGGENGILDIEPCKCSNASELLEDGDEIEYIGAKKKECGLMRWVMYNEELVTKGNCIIFICDGQGSVGYTNYIDHDFIGSTTLSVGRNKYLNQYTGLFLVTVFDKERYRYSFGRKYKKNLQNTKIKLPAIIDEKGDCLPDWDYMENYIKNLPYGDRI